MRRIIINILALSCILMGCDTSQSDKSVSEVSLSSASDSSIPTLDNSIAETSSPDDWNPTEVNTWRYLDWAGNTNGVLERWIEAYRSNKYSQIYIDDPRDGLFQSWRLTCDGSDEYLIERRYFADMPVEHCGYSRIITEGTIYYTFGEDLTGIDWLPLTFAHWDESILKAIRINEKAPVINKALQMIRKSYGDDFLGGGTKSLSDKYYHIVFEYLDGNIFEVVCKNHIILTD